MSTISDDLTPGAPDGSLANRVAPDASMATGAGQELGTANIDRVRDILFGAQMRDYDRRFARLEERLVKETTQLNDEVRKRVAALEEFVKRETESLAERIKAEFEARTDATTGLSRGLQDMESAFQRRAGTLDDQIGRAQRDLRQQLLEQHRQLSEELQQRFTDLLGRLDQESRALRTDKADRATIASLLTEMALRLTNELSLPTLDTPHHG